MKIFHIEQRLFEQERQNKSAFGLLCWREICKISPMVKIYFMQAHFDTVKFICGHGWENKQIATWNGWTCSIWKWEKYLLCVYFILWDRVVSLMTLFFLLSFFPSALALFCVALYFCYYRVFCLLFLWIDTNTEWTLWFLNSFFLFGSLFIVHFHLHWAAITVKNKINFRHCFSCKPFLQLAQHKADTICGDLHQIAC